MKKIPSLFARDREGRGHLLLPDLTPGCDWVLLSELGATATRKRDGTATRITVEVPGVTLLWKRYDAKPGRKPPPSFEPCSPSPDPNTGHWPGWVLVGRGPEDDVFHTVAWPTEEGSYEFCGPKVNGNAEGLQAHQFFRHGAEAVAFQITGSVPVPALFSALQDYLSAHAIEGIVWHHRDGERMCKIKRRDFGLPWPPGNAP